MKLAMVLMMHIYNTGFSASIMLFVDMIINIPYFLIFGITSGVIKKKKLDKFNGTELTWSLLLSRTFTLALDIATMYFILI